MTVLAPRARWRSPVLALGLGLVAFFLVSSYLGWSLVRPGRYRLMPWAHLAGVLACAIGAVLEARRLGRIEGLPWPRRASGLMGAMTAIACVVILWGFVFVGSRLPDDPVVAPAVAPQLVLLDDAGEPVRLDRRWATGPVVLAFFRGGFDGWARAALSDLERLRPAVEAAGGTVVVVGADPGVELRSLRRRLGLGPGLVLLADTDLTAARAFGLYATDPRALRPATFVVARGGKITWVHVPSSARDLPAADAILRALGATDAARAP